MLEPEGETETPETVVLLSEVERTLVVKVAMSEYRRSSRTECETPGEEGEEVKSPKRKVIRVESEETPDCVREAMDLSQEEAEEISFVPSATSVPLKPLFRCDK